jgi:hypothetical protein
MLLTAGGLYVYKPVATKGVFISRTENHGYSMFRILFHTAEGKHKNSNRKSALSKNAGRSNLRHFL